MVCWHYIDPHDTQTDQKLGTMMTITKGLIQFRLSLKVQYSSSKMLTLHQVNNEGIFIPPPPPPQLNFFLH